MPGSYIPEHVSGDSCIPPANAYRNINTDVTKRQADNQSHPVTFPVTYQKVPFPDLQKAKEYKL